MNSRLRSTLLCLLFVLPLASCGGGDDPAPAESPAPAPSPSLPTLAPRVDVTYGAPQIGASRWPARSTSSGGQGQTIGAINCGIFREASLAVHIHPHVNIFLNGQQLAVPPLIGIVEARPGQGACNYLIHTHDATGIIHIESPNVMRFTLGQLFAVWGQPLSSTNVAGITDQPIVFYIDDGVTVQRYTGDPADIEFVEGRGITIQIGTPISVIPTYRYRD